MSLPPPDTREADEAARWRSLVARDGEDGVALLRIAAHRRFRDGQWREAEALYALLAEARPRYAFLRRRAAWCRRHAEHFAAEHLTPAHGARVLAAVRAVFPDAVGIDSRVGPAGLNSISTFRHELRDAAGRPLGALFEKCYVGTEARGLARARLLFEHVDAAALLAPAWHGCLAAGPFRSSLHGLAAGRRPEPKEWRRIRRRIAAHLWQHAHHAALLGLLPQARLYNLTERLRFPGVFAYTVLWWPAGSVREWLRAAAGATPADLLAPHLPAPLLRRLQARRGEVVAAMRRLPWFVMHDDLNEGNVLIDGATIRTVDWDRWSIEPVGAGLPVEPGRDEARLLPPRLLAGGRLGADPPRPDDVKLAAVLWELRASHRAGRFAALAPLAELAVHYAER